MNRICLQLFSCFKCLTLACTQNATTAGVHHRLSPSGHWRQQRGSGACLSRPTVEVSRTDWRFAVSLPSHHQSPYLVKAPLNSNSFESRQCSFSRSISVQRHAVKVCASNSENATRLSPSIWRLFPPMLSRGPLTALCLSSLELHPRACRA